MGFSDFLKGAAKVAGAAKNEYDRFENKAADAMWSRYTVSELQDIANGYKDGNAAAARAALRKHGYSW